MNLPIYELAEFKNSEGYKQVMNRSKATYDDMRELMNEIADKIKQDGDQALLGFTKKFDGVKLENLQVTESEFKEAYKKVDGDFLEALNQAIENISKVHYGQREAQIDEKIRVAEGINVWREFRPVEKVGIYVPGGRVPYPSTVLMTVIPAQAAGCKEIVITTPPGKDGKVSPYILVAADKLGIEQVFKVGGAQAILGLALGTQSLPRVYKIFGPGNSYVAAAKLYALSNGLVNIDSPAGPSENLIIADDKADPRVVAADLITDLEHGDDSAGILLCRSEDFANNVKAEIENLVKKLSTKELITSSLEKYSVLLYAEDQEKLVEFANDYAPEHLQINTADAKARDLAKQIDNAGSVFVGRNAAKSAGDYLSGANHVLPTGGAAKSFSGLSTFDFMKMIEFQEISEKGLKNIRKSIEKFSEVEKLPAHGLNTTIRFND
jgi:histidinol dehydrogenase